MFSQCCPLTVPLKDGTSYNLDIDVARYKDVCQGSGDIRSSESLNVMLSLPGSDENYSIKGGDWVKTVEGEWIFESNKLVWTLGDEIVGQIDNAAALARKTLQRIVNGLASKNSIGM